MTILLFKILTTPTLILVATLVSRRFGQTTAGWLVGLPLTSGPIAVFLALEHGPEFARSAADGSLAGTVGEAFFAVVYASLARRYGWPACLAGASIAFAVSGLVLTGFGLSTPVLFVAACGSLVVGLGLIGEPPPHSAPSAATKWDLPMRMLLATGLVLLVTSSASFIGADLSGLAAAFPLYATVLGIFAHRQQGLAAAQGVMRGLLFGLFGFAGFFAAVSMLVVRIGLLGTFCTALAATALIQGATFVALRRQAN